MNNAIIVLCGKSGAGKDSLANLLKSLNYNFVKSTTTRPMRPNESEGYPYYFTTKDEFEKSMNANEFIEYRTYDTKVNNVSEMWFYGVKKEEIDNNKSYVVVLDIHGLKEFKKYFGKRVLSFYIEVDNDIRKKRSISRGGFDEVEWNRRLEDDNKVFGDNIIKENVDHRLKNEELLSCFSELVTLIVRNNIEVEEMEL